MTALVLPLLFSTSMPSDVSADEAATAAALLEAMSVDERVGQLFLVTFEGSAAGSDSDIADLITNFYVGAVAILAENDNVSDQNESLGAPRQVALLANDLQRLALTGQVRDEDERSPTGEDELSLVVSTPTPPENPVPLLVATYHEGDGYPYSSILSGLTEIPNNMAIGATWQPQYAQTVGNIVGEELAAIGINMLLGPSVDVLEDPDPVSPADLGTRSFGGDPYWVGQMGRAYTRGVHDGSNGRVAVIAKHFPGNGSSDRPVEAEVPTVRKSLEQLKQIELAPFFAVTDQANERAAITDGLLTTHIRYQGFQGNIRATTNPISFDRQALSTLMQLPQFATWRANGGLIVSDALGVRSVERFFDDTEQEFPYRRVARDALLAGNDLLFLADFALGDTPYELQLENIKDTILWFREIYLTDQPFQQRVDQAVLNILRLKLRLYGEDFSLNNVTVDPDGIDSLVEQESPAMLDLAQAALTLISPSPAELAERLDSPPGLDERIVIVTDLVTVQQCSTCPQQPLVGLTAVQDRILSLFGPGASEQVDPQRVTSFSTTDLQDFLDAGPGPIPLVTRPVTSTVPIGELQEGDSSSTPTPAPTPTPPAAYRVQQAFQDADWLIFARLGVEPESKTLSDFLALRPDIVHDAKVIVFNFGAPYYLDTTEVSKLTAYYALYSRTDPFIEASVRALFQESLFSGSPPVDVAAISYELFTQTQPDPDQVIELFIIRDGESQAPPSEAPLELSVGDTLHLQAGVIRDRNGNPVPDGTLVRFILEDRIQGLVSIIAEVPTSVGLANLDYVLEARTGAGQFRITAETGAAEVSQEVDISIEEEAQVAIITPTPPPTATPTQTSTPSPTPTSTATPTAVPSASPTTMPIEPGEPGVRIELSEFRTLGAVLAGLLLIGNAGWAAGRRRGVNLSQRMGWSLWGLVGSLLAYLYLTLRLPGTAFLPDLRGWTGLMSTLIGGIMALALFQIRLWLASAESKTP